MFKGIIYFSERIPLRSPNLVQYYSCSEINSMYHSSTTDESWENELQNDVFLNIAP